MLGRIVGSYKIVERIGEGGMGEVFKGLDLMLEREVAIKVLRPELARNPDLVERFRSEAVALARLSHPNVATLYSLVRDGDVLCMAMEFVSGETLDRMLRRTGAVQWERAVSIACQALAGIDHAHQAGILHRDIKPANIMLTPAGVAKVLDFGIARILGSTRLTHTGRMIGTLEYMSPEAIRGRPSDRRSDVYSVGLALYELLTGTSPFARDTEYEIIRAQVEELPPAPQTLVWLPDALSAAVMRALAKHPEERYQTASEFLAALSTPSERPIFVPEFGVSSRVRPTRLAAVADMVREAPEPYARAAARPAQVVPPEEPPPQPAPEEAGRVLGSRGWKRYGPLVFGVTASVIALIVLAVDELPREQPSPLVAPLTKPAPQVTPAAKPAVPAPVADIARPRPDAAAEPEVASTLAPAAPVPPSTVAVVTAPPEHHPPEPDAPPAAAPGPPPGPEAEKDGKAGEAAREKPSRDGRKDPAERPRLTGVAPGKTSPDEAPRQEPREGLARKRGVPDEEEPSGWGAVPGDTPKDKGESEPAEGGAWKVHK
jgi:serine/threonine-protein kinase